MQVGWKISGIGGVDVSEMKLAAHGFCFWFKQGKQGPFCGETLNPKQKRGALLFFLK